MIEIVLISNMDWRRHKALIIHFVGLHVMRSSCLGMIGRVGLMVNVARRTLRTTFAASLTSLVCAIWVLNQSQ